MPPFTAAEYYAHHYPYEKLVKLLTRNGDKLEDCEFAIEGKTASGDKLYKRYVSVRGSSELRDAVCRFPGVKAFHFGAFYSNGSAKEAVKSGESVPVRRVLSFDIDLTDLEFLSLKDADGSVSAEKCDEAYPVSAAAAYIVRTVMRKAFGFREILVVYSGRRGVHVHVFDDKAMGLNDDERSAVLDYVNCGMAKTELHAPAGVRLIMDLHGLRDLVYNTFHTYIVVGWTSLRKRRRVLRCLTGSISRATRNTRSLRQRSHLWRRTCSGAKRGPRCGSTSRSASGPPRRSGCASASTASCWHTCGRGSTRP